MAFLSLGGGSSYPHAIAIRSHVSLNEMDDSNVASLTPSAARGQSLDELIQAGPGTPAGRYLRSFWQPLYHSADIRPGEAKPLRIMSETFTLYRGESGVLHLVDPFCPHRGMRLS